MCNPSDSTLGLDNIYWFPYQWDGAVKRALSEGRRHGVKHRVYKQVFASGNWGWQIERAADRRDK